MNLEALDTFLQDLLWEKVLVNEKGDTIDIYRLKVVFSFVIKNTMLKLIVIYVTMVLGNYIMMPDSCCCFVIG